MKRILYITLAAALALCTNSCYPEYVKDFDRTAIYIAYQYDLRSFVVGEDESFNVGVALGGTVNNTEDRKVVLKFDDALVNGDLSEFEILSASDEDAAYVPFTAYDGMMGNIPNSAGTLINGYVTNEFKNMPAGFNKLIPLPQSYYSTIGNPENVVIKKGAHTATLGIKADESMFSDEKAILPYYAIGFRIMEADADTVLRNKSFEVIAVKIESKYFGNWYHGGKAVTIDNATKNVIDEKVYPTPFPQNEDEVYTLTTVSANSLRSNKISKGQISGELLLTFDGDDIAVSDAYKLLNIKPYGEGSYAERVKLLQDRKLYLNYQIDNNDGTSTIVTDTLTFRNRVRDGISEWQDEKTEHYEK